MDIIPKEFSLQNFESDLDEKTLFQMILDRVDYLISHDVDLLMSYLYRLDVEEKDIRKVMDLNAVLPANEGIARLILERQKKRIATKRKYKQDPIEGWDEY